MPRRVKIAPGQHQIALPDGRIYDEDDEVVLTDEEYAQIADTALGDEVLDLGAEGGGGGGGGGDPFPVQADFGGLRGYIDPDGNGVGIFGGEVPQNYMLVSDGQGGVANIVSGGAVQVQGGDSIALAVGGGPSFSLRGEDDQEAQINADHVYVQSDDFEITGDALFNGNAYGPILVSPDGTKYRLKVADGGALSTEVVP